MSAGSSLLLYASCVSLKGRGILLAGPSGVGKSDLALRMIDDGAVLVSDDQTELFLGNDRLLKASAPPAIAGLIEARHVGLLRLPYLKRIPVCLYVELTEDSASLARLPEPASYSLLDRPVPWLKLPAREASTPAKIRFVLQGMRDDTV